MVARGRGGGQDWMNVTMADAVALAKISGIALVDESLGEAATYGRFATGGLTASSPRK